MTNSIPRWRKGFAQWTIGEVAYLSIVFSWDAQEAYQRAVFLKQQGYKVMVGGPGCFHAKQRRLFDGVAEWGADYPEAVLKHNPAATFAVRGCPVGCYFCIVPKMEGKKFTYHCDFTPAPILCDNNLSATNPAYQDFIIRRYQEAGVKMVDAQSGFEPRTFTDEVYRRWRPLVNEGGGPWRFAYDETAERDEVLEMARILKDEPASRKRVYVLIGNEPFDDCMKRIYEVIDSGCDPHCQAYIKPNASHKSPVIQYDWTRSRLTDVMRWVNRWVWRKVPFIEFNRNSIPIPVDERQEALAL